MCRRGASLHGASALFEGRLRRERGGIVHGRGDASLLQVVLQGVPVLAFGQQHAVLVEQVRAERRPNRRSDAFVLGQQSVVAVGGGLFFGTMLVDWYRKNSH